MEKEIATTCTRDCPCGCSILVRVRDGEIVSQKADPRKPYTRSFLCIKGNRYVERYSSPHRLLHPMLRKREGFKPISWDDALDLVAEKLTRTRQESGPYSTLWSQYSGSLSLLNLYIPRIFWIHMGGTTVTTAGISIDALEAAQINDFGACVIHTPEDLAAHSKNVVIWGRNVAVTNVHHVPYLKEAQNRGARLTVVDPRFSETAQLADRHIAPRPGGDGYLAIAVAREVRRRQGEEPAFVRKRGTGWDGYNALLDMYEDDELLEKADVTAEEVAHLASAYWEDKPCASFLGLGPNWYRQGGAHCRLIHSLVFMSGNVGIPGGGANFFNMQFPFDKRVFKEEVDKAKQRGVHIDKPRRILLPLLGDEIEKTDDPPIRLAWFSMFNPVATVPDSNHVRNVIKRLEFVIVTEQFMTATAECADLILPATTYLEEDDVVHSHGHYYVGPVNAAVPPRGEARSNMWIFQNLAEKLGFGPILAGDPWTWIKRAWAPLEKQGITIEQVQNGPVRLQAPDVAFEDGTFRTPDGKFQFITEYEGRPELESGLTLLMVKRKSFLNSQLLPDDAVEIPTVYLNPGTMREAGVDDEDRVLVSSVKDQVEAVAKASEKTRRDVAELVPCMWKNDRGGINRLRVPIISDLGPTAASNETKVAIHKA